MNFKQPGKVKVINGSIITPHNAGLRIILNLCSQSGKYDNNLDVLLTKRWPKVKTDYREWYATQHNFKLGALNTNTALSSDTWMVQALVKDKNDKVDDKALDAAIKHLGNFAVAENASVHISTILVNEVPTLNDLLTKYVVERGVNCYFYEEPAK